MDRVRHRRSRRLRRCRVQAGSFRGGVLLSCRLRDTEDREQPGRAQVQHVRRQQ